MLAADPQGAAHTGFGTPLQHYVDVVGGQQQTVHVHSGMDTQFRQQIDRIFGCQAAGRARVVGVPAQAGDGGVEGTYAVLKCFHHVGDAKAKGVVEVAGNNIHGHFDRTGTQQFADGRRCAGAGGVDQADLPAAHVVEVLDLAHHFSGCDRPTEGAIDNG